jgi:hypothetical protein
VPHRIGRAGILTTPRFYATIPAVVSPAQVPAVQRQEQKKGVMDYVLTTADAVIDLNALQLTIAGCELGSTRIHMAHDFRPCMLRS